MGLNQAFVGKSYPASEHLVERPAMRAYARATAVDDPRLVGETAELASPMFGVVVLLPNMIQALFDPELIADANIGRMVHSSQDMRFLAPLGPGDRLRSTTRVQSIEQKGSGELLTVGYRTVDQNDQPVLQAESGFFFRGPPDPDRPPRAARPTAVPPEPLFSTGLEVASDQPARYAEASGDRNPIHLDPETARMMGFPGVIVHGLCTMALAQKAIVDAVVAGDVRRLRRLAVRFSKVVFPGDRLEVIGWSGRSPDEGQRADFVVRNQRDEEVIRDGVAEWH